MIQENCIKLLELQHYPRAAHPQMGVGLSVGVGVRDGITPPRMGEVGVSLCVGVSVRVIE